MSVADQDKYSLELRSFGRKRGRKATARQRQLLETALPKYAVDLGAPLADMPQPVWLEIGFGGGEHLIWQSTQNPAVQLIGCEPFEDGMVKVVDRVETDDIANVSLHLGDARDLLRALPPGSLSRVFILFPDPWPKRKHRKRRLVNGETLRMLARVMASGGELRIGTDIGDYARTVLEVMHQQSAFAWQARRPADWRLQPDDWPTTRYQSKALREGRRCYFLRFIRS